MPRSWTSVLRLCAPFFTCLYLREGEKWVPQEELLIPRASHRMSGEPDARLLDLLEAWERAANVLQKEETSVAVRLQRELLQHWRNWDKSLVAFRRVPQPRFSQLRERLFT